LKISFILIAVLWTGRTRPRSEIPRLEHDAETLLRVLPRAVRATARRNFTPGPTASEQLERTASEELEQLERTASEELERQRANLARQD